MSFNAMNFRSAAKEEFGSIRSFYWELIDQMMDRNDTIGWKKGIYPTDQFLMDSINSGELYILEDDAGYLACVILNSQWNEGYEGLPWSIACSSNEVLVPHALAVKPSVQGNGIGKIVVQNIIDIARQSGKKTVRLDILGGNTAAEHLYTKMGFQFVQAKNMFYEDTGWTEYIMYELIL